VLADDRALVRAGFRALLDAEADIEVVGEAAGGVMRSGWVASPVEAGGAGSAGPPGEFSRCRASSLVKAPEGMTDR